MSDSTMRWLEAYRLREQARQKCMEARARLDSAPPAEREEAQRLLEAAWTEYEERMQQFEQINKEGYSQS